METMQIDFEVHKLIEMERRGFDDPPISALRRLLKLPEVSHSAFTVPIPDGRGWEGEGVFLPNGTKLRMTYSGRAYAAEVAEGLWRAGTETFTSPSGAASGLARTKKGKSTRLDGWIYWQAQLPRTEEWIAISELRRQAKSQGAPPASTSPEATAFFEQYPITAGARLAFATEIGQHAYKDMLRDLKRRGQLDRWRSMTRDEQVASLTKNEPLRKLFEIGAGTFRFIQDIDVGD